VGALAIARALTHEHVEFAVDDCRGDERIFRTFADACAFAVSISLSGKADVHVDVLVYSIEGAEWWSGGDDIEFDEEQSVYERVEIKANSMGGVA
jgi:hypothetical protein